MSEDQILLERMVFFGYHGVPSRRAVVGSSSSWTSRCGATCAPPANDDLALTVNYSECTASRDIVEGPPVG